jgi:hypothetical protein
MARKKIYKLDCSRGLQSGHSMFTKSKSEAKKCIRELREDPHQVKLRLKKTTHTIRGKGWLIEA